jgi:hypothetical protein
MSAQEAAHALLTFGSVVVPAAVILVCTVVALLVLDRDDR